MATALVKLLLTRSAVAPLGAPVLSVCSRQQRQANNPRQQRVLASKMDAATQKVVVAVVGRRHGEVAVNTSMNMSTNGRRVSLWRGAV